MTVGIVLPVNNEHNGPAAWLQKSDHPVVRLGAQLMDFQLRHHLALPVNLQLVWYSNLACIFGYYHRP